MNWLLISILINICFLLFIIIIFRANPACNKIYRYVAYNDIYKNLKSGDLILFSNLHYNLITRTFGDSTFSHIGIVVKQNNKLYSLEMIGNDYYIRNKQKENSVILTQLKERITNYAGYVYISQKKIPLNSNQEQILYSYINKDFCFFKPTDIFKILYSIMSGNSSNIKVCSQYIINILEDLKIINNVNYYKPWNYHKIIINLCNNCSYLMPIQVISNELLYSR